MCLTTCNRCANLYRVICCPRWHDLKPGYFKRRSSCANRPSPVSPVSLLRELLCYTYKHHVGATTVWRGYERKKLWCESLERKRQVAGTTSVSKTILLVMTAPWIVSSLSSCWPVVKADPSGTTVTSSESLDHEHSCSLLESVTGTEPGGTVRTRSLILCCRALSTVRALSGHLNRKSAGPGEGVRSARIAV